MSDSLVEQARSIRAGLGPTGLLLGLAGGACGWLLADSSPGRADTVVQTAMTPVAVAAAAVLLLLVPARIKDQEERSGPQSVAQDMALTCLAAAVVAFVAGLVALGLPEGGWKVGGATAALMAVGFVLGSLVTLLGCLDKLR